jgi:hypothetical protein
MLPRRVHPPLRHPDVHPRSAGVGSRQATASMERRAAPRSVFPAVAACSCSAPLLAAD